MYLFTLFCLLIVFLIGTSFLAAVNGAFRRLHLQDANFEASIKRFFYRPFHLYFFPDYEYAGLLCATLSAQTITRFFYTFSALFFLLNTNFVQESTLPVDQLPLYDLAPLWITLSILGFIAALFIFGEYAPRILAALFPEATIKFCAPVSSLFMLLAFPLTYISLKLNRSHYHSISLEEPLTQTKREIIDIIQKTKLGPT